MRAHLYTKACFWAMLMSFALWTFTSKVHAQSYGKYENLGIDSSQILLDSAKRQSIQSPVAASKTLNRGLEVAILNRNQNGEARGYYEMAKIQFQLRRYDDARSLLDKCIAMFEAPEMSNSSQNSSYNQKKKVASKGQLSPSILSSARILRVEVQEASGKLEDALDETQKCLRLATIEANPSQKNYVFRLQARIKSKLGQNAEAVAQFESLLNAAQKAADFKEECAVLINFGEHYQRKKAFQKAKAKLERAIEVAKAHQLQDEQVLAKNILAEVYNAEGDLPSEVKTRNSVVNTFNTNDNSGIVSQQNFALSNAYLQNNNPDSAAKYVETGINAFNMNANTITTNATANGTNIVQVQQIKSSDVQQGADAYRQLAEGFLKKRELEKALAYFKKYAVLQDSVKEIHARELEEAIELSKNLGQNEARLQLLERERDVTNQSIALLQQDQSAKSDQIFKRNLIIGILAASLLSVVLAIFLLVRNTRARRRADKLLALQSMSGQMNPHFIFNALNSVNEFISQNDERAANRYLTAFSRLMRKVMDDSRQTFIPLNEEIEMLQLYLNLEHSRFKDQFEYDFEVDEALENADFELPPMMVQPYLENAIWHGLRYRDGLGKLSIHFEKAQDALQIKISDNGIGIEKSKALKTKQQKKQHSLGMKNIATRIALMNEIYGLDIQVQLSETASGSEEPGTTVYLRIPQSRKHNSPSTSSKTKHL